MVTSYVKGTQGKALSGGAESFHKGLIRGSYIRNLYLLCGMRLRGGAGVISRPHKMHAEAVVWSK